jgi:hypothetical protein
MEQVRSWSLLAVALGLLMAAACSRAVPGTPSADAGARGPVAGSPSGGPSTSATRARAPTLESDVLADECLLDAAQLGALLDRSLRVEQAAVRRADGTISSSCYAATRDAPAAPVAVINGHGAAQRRVAPCRSVATATAASRASFASSLVRVRSGARNRRRNASERRPCATCSPV